MANPFLVKILHLEVLLRFPSHVLLRDILSLIIELLTAGQANFHLHQAALEINLQGHQGIALLGQLAIDLIDLILMKQKLSHP